MLFTLAPSTQFAYVNASFADSSCFLLQMSHHGHFSHTTDRRGLLRRVWYEQGELLQAAPLETAADQALAQFILKLGLGHIAQLILVDLIRIQAAKRVNP
jgi:hypothetical protein